MDKRQWIISAVLTVVMLLAAGAIFNYFKSQKESTVSDAPFVQIVRQVRVGSFPPETVNKKIDLDGRLSAYEKINISAEVQGRLLATGKVMKEGSYFKKGDLLFKIDNSDDVYSLKAQRSQLFTQITQIMPDLKFDYPAAFQKWKQYLDDFNVDQNVKALPTLDTPQEKYFIGGKNIYNQYYTIKSLEERLTQYNVYAPFNGVFLSINSFPGALVTPGAGLGQIMNTYNYEMVSPIAMGDFDFLKVGQKMTLYSEELGKSWTGTVSRMSRQIDQMTQSIPVYISVSGSGLRDGMYLKGTLSGDEIKDVSKLPKQQLVNQNEVFVYQDSMISSKKVEVLSIIDGEAYVRGIDPDDQIIISSTNNLFAGQKVKI